MTFPKVQKGMANAIVVEITPTIIDDIEDKYFYVMIDKTKDISLKE